MFSFPFEPIKTTWTRRKSINLQLPFTFARHLSSELSTGAHSERNDANRNITLLWLLRCMASFAWNALCISIHECDVCLQGALIISKRHQSSWIRLSVHVCPGTCLAPLAFYQRCFVFRFVGLLRRANSLEWNALILCLNDSISQTIELLLPHWMRCFVFAMKMPEKSLFINFISHAMAASAHAHNNSWKFIESKLKFNYAIIECEHFKVLRN